MLNPPRKYIKYFAFIGDSTEILRSLENPKLT